MRFLVCLLALACTAFGPTASAQRPLHLTAPVLMRAERAESPVVLQAASIDVEAGAGSAQTTLDLTFHNPNDRMLEGTLEFPLAPGQQVVGFALDIQGRMRDAVPVEKARARQVFESIERRQVDPGLLEQTQGESFRLRVYPLPPRGTRRVRIVLLEPLRRDTDGWSTTLPLQVVAGLDAVPMTVRSATPARVSGLMGAAGRTAQAASGVQRFTLRRGDFEPARGVTLHFADAAGPRVQTQRFDGNTYFMAEVPAGSAAVPRTLPRRIGLLWDSSMSGERRAHDLELALLDAYFSKAGTIDVELVRLRDRADAPELFRIQGGQWQALRRALEQTTYDGATNPGGWTPSAAAGEFLLFSDGLFNYGDAGFPTLGARQRLYAVHAGSGGDHARLGALADRHGGQMMTLRDATDLAAASHALLNDAPRIEGLEAIGARDLVAESRTARDGVFRVAGRLTSPTATVRVRTGATPGSRVIEVPITDAVEGALAARVWANYSLAAMQADPARHRTAIAELGKAFRIVTPRTSLLVLDDVEDYVRHDIAPPAELQAAFAQRRTEQALVERNNRQARLDEVAEEWAARIAWWETAFPKKAPPAKPTTAAIAEVAAAAAVSAEQAQQSERHSTPPPPPMAPPPPTAAAAPAPSGDSTLDRVTVTASRTGTADGADAAIRLQPWQSDSPVARRLRQARAGDVYALYLDERRQQGTGTAFYLDVADILFEKKQPELALRVLSNLAEMELENRHVLRVLGYRLMQAGHPGIGLPVLARVLDMAEEEPQSYRDLGLAYAAVGQRQQAVETLYEVVQGDWDGRFPGVAQIALAELNAIVATSPGKLDTAFVDPRLLRNLPLALRTVLSWDSDNSDMDLWVTDPNGEKAYYGNRLTYQGGRMSNDFTGGYGPEEFALRDAKPGVYKVEANFFGERQQIVTGATTLQLWLSTGFGAARQRDRIVTLRLKSAKETVFVGDFEVE